MQSKGEEAGIDLHKRYKKAFPMAYSERFTAPAALYDIQHVEDVISTGKLFVSARDGFEKKNEPEWAARSRCDAAEMDLRTNRTKEARALVEARVRIACLDAAAFRPRPIPEHLLDVIAKP